MSGLHLIRPKGVTLVYAVDRGSPADAAGIHAGDVVEKVNEVSAANLSMREIRRALKASDGGTWSRLKFNAQGKCRMNISVSGKYFS